MYSLDAILWDAIHAAAVAKHPGATYQELHVRDEYALRLYRHIARTVVEAAVDAELQAEVFEQQMGRRSHATDQG